MIHSRSNIFRRCPAFFYDSKVLSSVVIKAKLYLMFKRQRHYEPLLSLIKTFYCLLTQSVIPYTMMQHYVHWKTLLCLHSCRDIIINDRTLELNQEVKLIQDTCLLMAFTQLSVFIDNCDGSLSSLSWMLNVWEYLTESDEIHHKSFMFLGHNVLKNCSELMGLRKINKDINEIFQYRHCTQFYVRKRCHYRQKSGHVFSFRVITCP